jgi:uncharacterized protein with HXXEE motif
VTFPRVAWCGVVVVALHNAEEAVTIPTWLPPRLATLEAELGIRPWTADPGRFYLGVLAATLVPPLWIALCWRARPRSLRACSILTLYGVFLVNAFVPHLLGALLLRSYVPGLITAVLLVIPFTTWLARRALLDGYVSGPGLLAALLVSALLYVPGLWALLGRSA